MKMMMTTAALFQPDLRPQSALGADDQIPLMGQRDYEGATSQALDPGELRTSLGALPLAAMEVDAQISGLVVSLRVEQTYVNVLPQAVEATYIFPLPHRAGVTKFLFHVAGRTVEGKLQERGEARRTYDAAISAGKRAAIAEEERPDVFTMRVGNLMPGEQARVELHLTGPLYAEDGEVTFRFPLVVARRYTPGAELPGVSSGVGVSPDTDAAPDASRVTPPVLLPGHPNPVHLGVLVRVDAPRKRLKNLRCSVDGLTVSGEGAQTTLRLSPGARLDRDLVLRYGLSQDAVESRLQVCPDATGEEGTFMLTLIPPAADEEQRTARDVIFVLDRSGSMHGWKMVAARSAVMRMIDTLLVGDRFTVMSFDSTIETPPGFVASHLNDATPQQRHIACEYLKGVEARGGTEMAKPLQLAAEALGQGHLERDKVLVLVTDGQVTNEAQILDMLNRKLRGARIFTVGIDQAVNASFLERLAALGKGACELVDDVRRLDEVMDRIHTKVSNPVLSELSVEVERQVEGSLMPKRLPALFDGVPLVVLGRYWGKPPSKGTVRARAQGASQTMRMELDAETSANEAMRTIWARGFVRDLEDRFATGDSRLEPEIVKHSLRFGVLCRFTAFVAVDAEVVNPGGKLHQVTQAVEDPHATSLKNSNMVSDSKRDANADLSPAFERQRERAKEEQLAHHSPAPAARASLTSMGLMRSSALPSAPPRALYEEETLALDIGGGPPEKLYAAEAAPSSPASGGYLSMGDMEASERNSPPMAAAPLPMAPVSTLAAPRLTRRTPWLWVLFVLALLGLPLLLIFLLWLGVF